MYFAHIYPIDAGLQNFSKPEKLFKTATVAIMVKPGPKIVCKHVKSFSKNYYRMMIRSVDLRQKEKQLLDRVLGPDVYDRRIRPGIGNITSGKP